jgi:hypothetical protein
MATKHLLITALIVALLAGCGNSSGAAGGSAEEARQQLAQSYIAALQAKDPAKIEALLHPAVRACENAATKEYFDFLRSHAFDNVPGAEYKVNVSPIAKDSLLFVPPKEQFPYPVPPIYQFQIDWNRNPDGSDIASVVRAMAPSHGSWFVVYPCPNAAGIKEFRERMAKGWEQKEHAKALAADLKEPLKGQLLDLLKQRKRIDAVKAYREATGADLTTASLVMDALGEPN